MVALVIILTVVVLLLTVLVAGLLRSHADILKALHELGVGVGDPVGGPNSDPNSGPVGGPNSDHHHDHSDGQVHRRTKERRHSTKSAPNSTPVPFTMRSERPGERNATSAPTIAGVTPSGDALAIAVSGNDQLTLVAFLSSGCATCVGFGLAFLTPHPLCLP